VGLEFQVNSYTTGDQEFPHVAWGVSGSFVAVWANDVGGAGVARLQARRFDPGGASLSGEVDVTATFGLDRSPVVTTAATGEFVVAWYRSPGIHGQGVFARRFDALGTAGPEFQVRSSGTWPDISSGPAGGFVITWTSFDASAEGVFARRYDALGSALGSDFRLNTFTTGRQMGADIAADAEGNFVVVWESAGQDGDDFGIFGQRFDAAGVPRGGEFQINSYTTGPQVIPLVARAGNGGFLVTWRTWFQDGVYARVFDPEGVPVAEEFRVNSFTTGYQIVQGVAADHRGNFAVVWGSEGQDGSSYAVMARLYDDRGRPHGGEFTVNSYLAGTQLYPAVAFGPEGRFVVTWHSNPNQDGSRHGIFAQVLAQDLVFRDGFE
jgi:hypothetical protein